MAWTTRATSRCGFAAALSPDTEVATTAYGIYSNGASTGLAIDTSTVVGEASGSFNYGLYSFYGSADVSSSAFVGRGGTHSRGVVNYGSGAALVRQK